MHKLLRQLIVKQWGNMQSLPKDLKPIIDSIDDQLNNGSNEAGSFAVSGQEASNQELQKLMGMIPDAIFRLNSKGVILDFYSSDQWDTLIPPSEFINKPLDQTELPKNIVEAAMEKIKEALNSDQMQIHEYSLKMNDEIRYFESRYVKVEKDVVLSMVRDVTEWKNIQVEIEESEKKYRNLIQLAPEALMIFNLDLGKFVEYNAEAERLFGYSGDEL